MENPIIAGFIEMQQELRTWAWSGKTTEGQSSPSDCHKPAKMISDEEFSQTLYAILEPGLKFFIKVVLQLHL
jgi:hypothetical protein